MSDEINFPTGFSFKDIIAWGNSGMVLLDQSTQTIIKTPHGKENACEIDVERRIYQRLRERGGHPGILNYHEDFEDGFRLDFASHGNLSFHLETADPTPNIEQRLHWCHQIATALQFAHCNGVIHGNLRCGNIVVDHEMKAKLADFGGSSLDGSPLLISVTASHLLPGSSLSIQGDIFALGSTCYEIMTGFRPYVGLSDEEIQAFYATSRYPDVTSLGPIGQIILSCWQGQYHVTELVAVKLNGIYPDIAHRVGVIGIYPANNDSRSPMSHRRLA